MKYLLTDVDGVLLDWVEGFCDFANTVLGTNVNPNDIETYDMLENFEITMQQKNTLINTFHTVSPKFRELSSFRRSLDVLPWFMDRGYTLIAITAVSNHPNTRDNRLANLHGVFGPIFSDVHFTNPGEPKTEFLKVYPQSIWVEDSPEHAMEGLEVGHHTFLMDQPYNEDYPCGGITRVNNWIDIYKIVNLQ